MNSRRFGARLNHQTLMFKVALSFVLIIFVNTVAIGAVLYYRSLTYVQDGKNLYGRSLSRNLSAGVDTILERMDRVAKVLIGDPDIQSVLENSGRGSYSNDRRLADATMISKLLFGLTSFQDHFVIALYDADGNPVYRQSESFASTPRHLFDNVWLLLNRWRVDARQLYFVPPYRSQTILVGGDPAFYVIRALNRIENNSIAGYVTVAADSSSLDSVITENLPAGRHVDAEVLDRQGLVAVSNNVSAEGTRYRRIDAAYNTYRTLSSWSGLITNVELPPEYITSDLRSIQLFVLLITLVTMSGCLGFSLLLSTVILRPLRSFATSMSLVADGNFEISLSEDGLDADMLRLHRGFNRMVREIRRLIHDVYEQSLLAKSAQLEALQYQINPHFLYNTLQTMEAIAEVHEVKEIQIIASSLARLFRYNVEPTRTVSLRDEIEQAETYFQIENIRFCNSLQLRESVPAHLLGLRVLKFILQPIVENSIRHGFSSENGAPHIVSISAHIAGGMAEICVRDTGEGMSGGAIARVRGGMHGRNDNEAAQKKEIGLANVHRRLVNFYGQDAGLDFRIESGWATVVVIRIPAVVGEGRENGTFESVDRR